MADSPCTSDYHVSDFDNKAASSPVGKGRITWAELNMDRKALGELSTVAKFILLIAIAIFVIVFLMPKILYGADKFLGILGIGKCSFKAASCVDCLKVVSADPSSIEFRKEGDWEKSACNIRSKRLNLNFNEKLKPDLKAIDLRYSCNKVPFVNTDWQVYDLQASKPIVKSVISAKIEKNLIEFDGFEGKCYYRIYFGKNLLSETDKGINDQQQVVVFKT